MTTARRARGAAFGALAPLLVLVLVTLSACGSADGGNDALVELGRRPAPYTRRTVTTVVGDVSTTVLDPRFDFEIPETVPRSTTIPSSGRTSTTLSSSTSSSTSTTTAVAPTKAECKQLGELIDLVGGLMPQVDPNDASVTAARFKPVVDGSKEGLDQLLDEPISGVAAETSTIVEWMRARARGTQADDAAATAATERVKDWHKRMC